MYVSNGFEVKQCDRFRFLDDLDRLGSPDYCPSETDVLNARTPTLGVNESHYAYNGKDLRIVDVGGQKSERRKWITAFDNVNAVIFFAAISEYDQMMAEDGETNRLRDALRLFNDIAMNPLFDRAHMILFLNKKDLFEEKIRSIPLRKCFPNYKFKNNYKTATSYIIRKFEKYHRENKKNIYSHLTCAKDTGQMQFLTETVADMVIQSLIKHSGIGQ
ncbi:guanine nucleotide-binding protein G(I) subunit alpha 65A [Aphelenchoides avenae]|nr:guanine nucleotide-binding protein G(I) subunit alpha 65A [Aphelenchus avenae]KAH7721047.1 guanine nucleotide-binding protein G(I) subunit alpha 65A [Aphelenchus avenae]